MLFPSDSIDLLSKVLIADKNITKIPAKKRLLLNSKHENRMCILLSGAASLLRKQDGLLLGNVKGKYIFGLNRIFCKDESDLIIRSDSVCELVIMGISEGESIISLHGLWYSVSDILSFHVRYMVCRDERLINKRSRDVVMSYIEEIRKMPDNDRVNIKMLQYIQERSGLSRSSIMNIFAEMRNEKLIITRRGGVLLSMEKSREKSF
ncbi:helix-turn-helix domain-containing protein [Scandinavium goeteborgense]|uniref:helix-turn-helix domain-containing protein n=1 Tax=Scandinavium goeteborgense TaxID=1851514 RepID=UPI000F69220E|nr:helix-turn-helix domain-containing protein [Scandinavium goeteborgense]QKN79789.1 helix-turn-helix domain-containing protein [Scandinavium goeteborgense]